MTDLKRSIIGSCLLGLMILVQGCVVTTREGYYDREHHRYWHERAWHDCIEHDVHCE